MQQYRIEGVVVVPATIDPGSIEVYTFLEGASATSELPLAPGESDHATPDDSGSFIFYAWLHTDSTAKEGRSSRGRDRCRRRAESVDVVAIGEGVEAKRVRAHVSRPADGLPTARVSPVVLRTAVGPRNASIE
jgi:hypothetical protein